MFFSIIVPVYNRPDEVADLIKSLKAQTDMGFELVLVEDVSTVAALPDNYDASPIKLKYYKKSNEGRSIARNYGLERAEGDFFIFVDSDCILPPDYIEKLRKSLKENPSDCFGGPDAAHDS
ncbi:MAG: glycosyltransferase, partial [Muribaculaceae bacterium]|nr:glycosyltransferase [Muribaculaceae bacterium]